MTWFAPFGGRAAHERRAERDSALPARFRVEALEPRLLLSGDPLDLLKDSLEPAVLPEPVVAIQDTQHTTASPSIDWGSTVIAPHDDADDGLPAGQSPTPLTTPE